MKTRILLPLLLAALCATAMAQIGTKIPDARLPLVTSSPRYTKWQDAGYLKFVPKPILYSLLIDVTTLGAVGDGVTDDTAAFQSALTQAAAESALGGFTIVYAPAGTYKITATLSIPSDTVLKGAGSTQTTLNIVNATGNCINVSSKQNFGIEDLKLTTGTSNTTAYFIYVATSQDGWIRGIETSYVPKNHIRLYKSSYIEVRDCYIHHGLSYGGGGYGYGVELDIETDHCLIENNVLNNLRHSMALQNDVKWNVFGYNASYNPTRTETFPDWAADIICHGHYDAALSGPYENLFEGNMVNHMQCDETHEANGNYNTFFRNRSYLYGVTIGASTSNQNLVNNYLRNYNFLFTIVGNPWAVSGSGHLAKNNRCYQKTLFSWKTFWKDSQDATYLTDYSYYLTAKPAFLGALAWPFDAYSGTNAAANRGFTTVTAGWSDYSAEP